MESPLLRLPGAVPAEGPDAGVAAHYGDPLGEQRALAQAAGLVDRSHRGIVRITGPDRLSWLNSLTTQQLGQLPPGSVVQALILSPNGHVEHHLTLTDDGEAVWAHVEPGTAAELVEFLESMRFMLRVEPADVSGEYALLTLMGPDAPHGRPPVTAALPGGLGTDLIVPRDQAGRAGRRAPAGRGANGRDVGVRGAADRGPSAAPRPGHRSPDDPARGRLDRDRGAPGQGLLPGPGNRGPGAQPGAPAAAAGPAAARRQQRPAPPRTATRSSSTGPRSGSSGRPPGTTSSGRSRWRW